MQTPRRATKGTKKRVTKRKKKDKTPQQLNIENEKQRAISIFQDASEEMHRMRKLISF